MKINNLFRIILISCAAFLLAVFMPVKTSAQETKPDDKKTTPADTKEESSDFNENLKYYIEVGGQYKKVTGEKPSKFEEYGGVRSGLWIRRFKVSSNPPNSREFFRLIGKNVGEDDQQYILDFGKYNLFRTKVTYDGNPHLFARDTRSFFTRGYDVLEVNDDVQTTLQNTPIDAVVPIVQNYLATAARRTIKSKRDIFNFNQTFEITKNWSFRFNWMRQKRSGYRPLGTGSYERVGTPIGDTFRVHSIELPQPTDSTSDQFTIGTSYLISKWGVNFDYIYSMYKNNTPSIIYDNPFRITDMQATSGGNFDRMKMAQGAQALEPSNHSQTFAISAFVDLPLDTRAAGAWSWSFWKQDEQFLPYTLNTAVVTGVPAGLNITSTSSLPEQNLDGKVNIFTQDYVIASRPFNNWAFNVHYRRYDNDNQTHHILFPGYVAYLDSYWRTNIAGVPIENEVQSFTRSNVSGDATWDISRLFRFKLGYEWEGWTRENRQATKTRDHIFSTQFTYNPTGRFTSRLNYKYSTRTPENYNPGVKEFALLRMFDQARRIRHDADWQWQYSLNDKFGVSGTLGWQSDDYDQHYYGLVRYEQKYGSLDLLYMPKDNTTFYFNYSREDYKNFMQTIAKTAVPYDFRNRWNREEKDSLNNFGVGVTAYAFNEKMLLDLHYVLSDAKTRTSTYNLEPVSPINVLNATAYPFPDVKTRFQEFNSDISYQFTDKWGMGLRYIYQPYTLDDYAWNNLSPYPVNLLPAEQDGRRFLLLDSRYSNHKAHVIGVYFRFDNK